MLILSILFLSFENTTFSQIILQGKNFNLGISYTGDDLDVTARDYIILKPGFEYLASTGASFHGHINQNLILPTTYTNKQTVFNTALPVGTLPGSIDVSPTGAATYSISIALPPGTAGVMPNLSIVYNSQSGDGMLGHGWTIGGFSAISRVPADMYHDGMIDAVDFDENDRLALDGQRLIATEGDYHTANTKYHTEIETFTEITQIGIVGGSAQSFSVLTKDGKILEYGNTEDSRISASGRTDIMFWLLNKITDSKGNYYTVTYHKDANEFYPVEIKYTGNAATGLNTYNTVKFFYTSKTDKQKVYIAGSCIKSTVLLDKIRIYNEGGMIRKYQFRYKHNFNSYLSEIFVFEDENTMLNSTKIEWGNLSVGLTNAPPNSYVPNVDSQLPGDFDGDGRYDLLEITETNGVKKWTLHTSEVSPSGSFYLAVQASDNFYYNDFETILPGDFDGDGKTDLLMIRKNGTHYDCHFMKSEENYFDFNNTPNFTIYNITGNHDFNIGDFNGDGATDLFVGSQNIFIAVYTIINSPFALIAQKYIPKYIDKKVFINDYNGNGLSDILTVGINSVSEIYEWDQTIPYSFSTIYSDTYLSASHYIYPGDFNGDGKSDLLTWSATEKWNIKL